MSDCNNCLHTCGYPNREWYPLYLVERHYCRVMLLFILENMEQIRRGEYPPDPTPNGYTNIDPNIRCKPRLTDSKERVKQLAAEIDARLFGWYKVVDGQNVKVIGCGIAGKLLEAQAQNGMDIWEIHPEARQALNYISGVIRKRQSFITWRKEQNRRKKIHQKVY